MLSWPGRLAVTLFAACLLAGCQPAAPPPTPVPTYACTPEAGGAEFSCSQQQYDEMVAKDELYAEAEAVYRRFFAEDVRILREGGLAQPTATLVETATGDFLTDSMEYYQSLKKEDSRLVGGEIELVELSRVPGVAKAGSVVAMKACIDASTARIVINGHDSGPGRRGSDLLYFGQFEGRLKIQGADGQEGETCG